MYVKIYQMYVNVQNRPQEIRNNQKSTEMNIKVYL